ncbi:MAG TPA: hypothetical protein VMG12_10360 [Polyangiaceae bacterium]|nr:hypothetical protein [Polyangiaceae bacterium]
MTDPKFLPAFAGWLRLMGEDVLSLANLLDAPEAPAPFRQAAAEALNALIRQAQLIPEGIEALGYLEGAFAFRVIAEHALAGSPEPVEGAADGRVPRLAADAALVTEFLGDDLPRFREIWLAPEATARAGRAAGELLEDEALRQEVLGEAREWVERYQAPELGEGPEELVKVESFFRTRLRRVERAE